MMSSQWRRTSAVFHEKAHEYDKWYDDSLIFDIEMAALRELTTPLADPKLEVGVGPGRFASSLDISYGLDPAFAPLKLASQRGITVMQAVGEQLPVGDGCVATVYLLFALCFLQDPGRVFAECHRILQAGGHLVVGMIPTDGAWGKVINAKKRAQHPFYKYASLCRAEEVAARLRKNSFDLVECRSTLSQEPDRLREHEQSQDGLQENAGFCLLVGEKAAC